MQCCSYFWLCAALALLVSFLHVRGLQADDAAAIASCSLCASGQATPTLNKSIAVNWPVHATTCSELDEIASSLLTNSENCTKIQSIASLCDCPPVFEPNPCLLCGETMSRMEQPQKELSFLASNFDGTAVTCEVFDAYLQSSINDTDENCQQAQLAGWTCGCASVLENNNTWCDFCRGDTMADPQKDLNLTQEEQEALLELLAFQPGLFHFQPFTCELYAAIASVFQADSLVCPYVQEDGYVCGCNEDELLFRRRLLNWLPRTAAILSLFGSSFIIWDIWKNKQGEQRTVQAYLLVCMSIIDIMSSLAWSFSASAVQEVHHSAGFYIYGAKGTRASCTAQGFFIQLGLTSPFYNCTLALYYLLIVSFGWSDTRIQKYKMCFLGIPFAVGLAFALAAIPFYGYSATMCYVVEKEKIFLVFPIATVIFFATLFMIKIWLDVYHQEHRVQRWRASGPHDLTKKVFWQAFWYLMCFYASWPIVIALIFMESGLYIHFGFHCLGLAVAPLQGWLNCIAYSRLKILRRWHQLKCSRLRQDHTFEMTTGAIELESTDRERTNSGRSPFVQVERATCPAMSAPERVADESITEEANFDS